MPTVAAEAYEKLNLMAGTARSLETEALTPADMAVWNRDFKLLCDDLSRIVDPQLGEDLRQEKGFYDEAIKVAKGQFDRSPFGGLKAATGEFGFRLLAAQDLLQASTDATNKAYYDWVQTVTTDSAETEVTYLFGYSSAAVYACNEAAHRSLLAWHRLLSYKPSPRLVYLKWYINDYPYVPYCVEPFSKIAKADKLFKIIPMPGRVIIHPGGSFYAHGYFDRQVGATAPSGTASIDIELALFGLVFAEYEYLSETEIT